MAQTKRNSFYERKFDAAAILFDNDDMDGCITAAKRNLADPELPPFFIIKNCIIIACALNNWDDADVWRLRGEHAYSKALERATELQDAPALEVLKDLREELDEVWQIVNENSGVSAAREDDLLDEDLIEQVDSDDSTIREEDEDHAIPDKGKQPVPDTKSELEPVAEVEDVTLPVRLGGAKTKPANSSATDIILQSTSSLNVADTTEDSAVPTTGEKKVRRSKSTMLFRTAVGAVEKISKSIGKKASRRPSVQNIFGRQK